MIQLGRYNPIFFNPRRYRYGTGEYVQRFDVEDLITFEFFSGKGETAAVRLNNLSTGEAVNVEMTVFSLSDDVDVHYASLQPGEGMYSVTIGDTQSIESEPFCVCQCRETTSLLEYSNADNNVDMGAFVNGEERIPFMFRFEGGFIPFGTEYRVEDEAFRNQRQRIRHLYSGAYEVLKLTVGDTSMGCPEWYASFFNTVLCLSEIKINGEVFARGEGAVPEKTQMQEGSNLIYFTIDMEAEGGSVAGTGGGNFNQGGGGGFSVYIITTDDLTAASDKNVFSALRTILEIEARSLSKTKEDTTNFLLNLLGGIITDFIQSTDFVSGAMGTGMCFKRNADGTTYAEVDKLLVRMNAYFQMLTIMRTEVGGATMMFNPSGARITITKVEHIDSVPFYYSDGSAKYYSDGSRAYVQPSEYGAVYRCYFLADDGETAVQNLFRPGNLARSQSFNIKSGIHEGVSNRFFWRLVTAVGDDWIELSATHCAEGSDIPQEGDVVCQMGDISDPDYQSAIVLSAFGNGAPYLTFYQGIDSYSLSGKDVFTVGYDSVKRECFMRGYGRMYFGDRERTTYIEYTKENGLQVRARKFLLETGEDIGEKISSLVGKEQLKATGIDIDSKTVKVTASQFLVQDNGGTGIAVFKLVNGKPVLKAENIDVDGLKVKHLEGADGSFSGELKAVTGTYSSIKATSGNNSMLLNGSLITFTGPYSTVRLGADAIPDSVGGSVTCPLYIDTHRSGANNIGISVRATGGGKNYGLSTNAAVLAASLVGTRAKRLTFSSGGGTIDFSQDSLFIITCNGDLNYTFPNAVSVMDMFGYDSLPEDFGYLFLIHLKIGSGSLKINGVYNEEGHYSAFTMYPGDSTWFLAYSSGVTVRYQIVSKYA